MPEAVNPQVVVIYRTRRGIHVYDSTYDASVNDLLTACRKRHPGCSAVAVMAGSVHLSDVAPVDVDWDL